MMGGYGFRGGYGCGFGGHGMGMIFGLLLIVGLGCLVYFAVKRITFRGDDALQSLRLRLVKGEITPEEYKTMLETLRTR